MRLFDIFHTDLKYSLLLFFIYIACSFPTICNNIILTSRLSFFSLCTAAQWIHILKHPERSLPSQSDSQHHHLNMIDYIDYRSLFHRCHIGYFTFFYPTSVFFSKENEVYFPKVWKYVKRGQQKVILAYHATCLSGTQCILLHINI